MTPECSRLGGYLALSHGVAVTPKNGGETHHHHLFTFVLSSLKDKMHFTFRKCTRASLAGILLTCNRSFLANASGHVEFYTPAKYI